MFNTTLLSKRFMFSIPIYPRTNALRVVTAT